MVIRFLYQGYCLCQVPPPTRPPVSNRQCVCVNANLCAPANIVNQRQPHHIVWISGATYKTTSSYRNHQSITAFITVWISGAPGGWCQYWPKTSMSTRTGKILIFLQYFADILWGKSCQISVASFFHINYYLCMSIHLTYAGVLPWPSQHSCASGVVL